jgi:hypothetical protein
MKTSSKPITRPDASFTPKTKEEAQNDYKDWIKYYIAI